MVSHPGCEPQVGPPSIRKSQPLHRELDFVAQQFVPGLDRGHVRHIWPSAR
jgi:hypothetical protein